MAHVTQILNAIEQGDPKAAAELLPLVYDELRKLAAARLADEKPGQTLQPTALVHEAYVRLVGGVSVAEVRAAEQGRAGHRGRRRGRPLASVVVLVISNISIRREEQEKSEALDAKAAALEEKSAALIAKAAALNAANASRRQAEEHLELILAALDQVYIAEAERRSAAYRSDPDRLVVAEDPRQAGLEREFSQKGLSFYEKLIQPGNAEPVARFQTGKAYRRVGVLRVELKQNDGAASSTTSRGSASAT